MNLANKYVFWLIFMVQPKMAMQQQIAIFSGMLGVTIFGLIFTPVFYVLCRRLSMKVKGQKLDAHEYAPQ